MEKLSLFFVLAFILSSCSTSNVGKSDRTLQNVDEHCYVLKLKDGDALMKTNRDLFSMRDAEVIPKGTNTLNKNSFFNVTVKNSKNNILEFDGLKVSPQLRCPCSLIVLREKGKEAFERFMLEGFATTTRSFKSLPTVNSLENSMKAAGSATTIGSITEISCN